MLPILMDLLSSILSKKEQILEIARRHGATNVRVFGSIVRNAARPDSDVDLLVDVGPSHSPWFPVRLINDLKALLDRDVDIVTERSIHPLLREQILREAVRL